MRMRVQIGLPPFDHTLRLTRLPEITLTINFWTWTCSIFVHGCLAMTLEDIYYVFFIKDLRTIISLVFSRFYLIKHKWTLILYMRNIYNFSMPCWTVNVFSSVMYSLKKINSFIIFPALSAIETGVNCLIQVDGTATNERCWKSWASFSLLRFLDHWNFNKMYLFTNPRSLYPCIHFSSLSV